MSWMMRIVRFVDATQRQRWGVLSVDDPEHIVPIAGDPFGSLMQGGTPVALSSVRLLAPASPSKVVGVASNYRDHAAEMGKPLPEQPRIFLKPPTAVIGPNDAIQIPPGTERVDHEAELGVVIGRTMRRVPAENALDHVLGFCCLNDVTARDLQRRDGLFARAKGFDTFCPLGPWVTLGLEPFDLSVRSWVDGELRQDGTTADMVFDVPTLLAFISGVMTLQPGDVIATGTPAGVGPIEPGQTVSVEIGEIGRIDNPVELRADREASG